MELAEPVVYDHGRGPSTPYPAAIVNVTNRCNLSCAHCFIYRDDNPNESLGPRREPADDAVLELLADLRDRHGIRRMLWMGGEPLLRPELVRRGVELFEENTVTTNGTRPLPDLGLSTLYVVSLDGPPKLNDAVRGEGTFERVMARLSALPAELTSPVQVQCTVTPVNQGHLRELVELVRGTPVQWMTFSFAVPSLGEGPELCWPTLEERMVAVEEVRALKSEFPDFVRNRRRALQLMSPELAPRVTEHCLARQHILPLWLDGDRFITPYCCYGNDVDCARCGAWVVFELAAQFEPLSGSHVRDIGTVDPPRG
jgi:MoaA/NifB/PqqE/SkfB family radical SAM enzyme